MRAAIVDSAPRFSLRPAAVSPSNPAPVDGSNRLTPTSLRPTNQPQERSRPTSQAGSAVTSNAHAQASAIAAGSIGCWSNCRRPSSSGPRPAVPVTDRWSPAVSTVSRKRSIPSPRSRWSRRPSCDAGDDQHLRERRVGVPQPVFGPAPHGDARVADGRRCVFQQRPRSVVHPAALQDGGRAEARESHRPQVGAARRSRPGRTREPRGADDRSTSRASTALRGPRCRDPTNRRFPPRP